MDLFHAVTQGIESVLTCDWYDSFKGYTPSDMASGPGNKTMDTVPGGESTQYESIQTVTNPTEKERGQLGSGPNTSEKSGVSDERGQTTTENIRYGQNISESGVGGMTTTSTGSATQSGGYGGKPDDSEDLKNTRREQGYGPGSGVGA
ncbi:uncharacterized protein A1O9_06314 [Exophiala aquamarina CBS 119918]|uniref:Uncharacterized protein n=1 Tax=Exophiala aquamarina CBS 119918 TaxID=1182545 RepID=A0A072PGH0_9EURO|nr:uncharacterized protein A1O9_06314 [Exophiala aquamarina CBS 119918]KEF58388.1 hypothetical protein A1O9_06314 [Exophiala aquamarina CBS 119918]